MFSSEGTLVTAPQALSIAKNLVIHEAASNQKLLGCAGTSAQAGQQSLGCNKAGT